MVFMLQGFHDAASCRSEYEHLKVPRSIQDTQELATVLSLYKDRYYLAVMAGLAVLYVL